MIKYNEKNAKRWAVIGERPTFGLTLLELAKEDSNIMAVVADTTNSAGLERMKNTLPEQFLNVGIAEQNMMGIATGLASEGYKVVTTTFAPFQTMRCLEQIRVYQGYMQQKLVMVGLASGVAYGELGHTHCCIEDVSLLRSIPNLAVVCPADCMEVAKVLEAALDYDKAVYIRLLDKTGLPIVYREDYDFEIGKAIKVYGNEHLDEDPKTVIIANGTMVFPAMEAAKALTDEHGIEVSVYDMHTIKPLDENLLDQLGGKAANIITVEEHSVIGGLGSAIAEYFSDRKQGPAVFKMGIPDEYCHSASHETILHRYGLTKEGIVNQVTKIQGGLKK